MIKLLEQGKIAVLKIDVQGAISAMEKRPDALSIMLLPPSAEELERLIRQRGTEDLATIDKRLRNALEEIAQAHRYHHQVINEDLTTTISIIEVIVSEAK
jgi:guanylate kinase